MNNLQQAAEEAAKNGGPFSIRQQNYEYIFIEGATWQQSQSVEQPEVHQLTGITELDNLLAEYSKNKWSIDVLTGRVWNMAYRAGQLSTPTPEMKWVSEKPKADHECILLTASYYDGWNYNSFEIQHTRGVNENGDDAWYFGIYDLDGSEWGAYDDIEADLYCTVEIPAPPLNPQDNEQK